MGIKQLKSVTPGSRFASRSDFSELTTRKPEKSLTRALRKSGGRNNTGRITMRRRGGGHKRRYRIIDFKRDKFDMEAKVMTVEYDPNRSANISLLQYDDGEKRYILSPVGLKVDDKVISGEKVPLKTGNSLILKNIPAGLFVHNIELLPGKGAQMVRSLQYQPPQRAVRRRGHQQPVQLLLAPAVFHELHRQPIEQLGVRGRHALRSKIVVRLHNALPE